MCAFNIQGNYCCPNYIQYIRPIIYASNRMKVIPITILPIHYTTPDRRLGS